MTNPDLAALSAAAIAARAQYESGQADLKAMLSASQEYLAALETEFLLGNLVHINPEGMRERVKLALEAQMEAMDDETIPSSIQRDKGLVWLEGWFDLDAAIAAILVGE